MLLRRTTMLLDKANEGGSPSGNGTSTTQTTTPTQTPQATGNDNNPPAGDKTPAAGEPVKTAEGDKSQQATPPAQQTQEVKDTTGYGAGEPTKTEPGAKANEGVKEDVPLELDLKGFKEEELKDIRDFAKKAGLTKEQAQLVVDQRRSDADAFHTSQAQAQEAAKAEKAATWEKWGNELRTEWAGTFDQNVHNVNKVINEHFPSIKNVLTSTGDKLPPSVMKDLAKVHGILYGEKSFVTGQESGGGQAATSKPWDFYKK